MKRRSNRILTYALALSLAIHLVFAFVFRNVRPVEAHEEPIRHITITEIHTPPPPMPTPTPAPPKPQPPIKPSHPIAHPPHVTSSSNPHVIAAEPVPTPGNATPGPDVTDAPPSGPVSSPAPTPTPTPKPLCAVPNVAARAVNVMNASIPDGVSSGDVTARVRVTLEANGSVANVSIYQSAGNMLLDRAAMLAARQSTYRAEIRNCMPVGGDYLFTVNFQE